MDMIDLLLIFNLLCKFLFSMKFILETLLSKIQDGTEINFNGFSLFFLNIFDS